MAPRLSLLGKFSVLSFLVIASLGVAIGLVLHERIERRALTDAERAAALMARVGVQSYLSPSDLEGPLTPERLFDLDRELQKGFFRETGIARVKVFNGHGMLVYSDDRESIGSDHATSEGVRAALAGEVSSEVEHGTEDSGHGSEMLEAYVPLRWMPDGDPAGVLEVYLPYGPVAEATAADTRTLVLLLAGGLLLLYGMLFRIVAGASRRLRHQALHDALTGLPNRALLHERLQRAIAGARKSDSLLALLLIDLDRFKEVNDTLGHDHGDELLCEVASRLRGVLRADDLLARLGGDEFAVLVANPPHRGAVAELAGRLCDSLDRPFALRGVSVELGASIGVALFPEHGTDVGTLVQRADVAMYEAKRTRTRIETYAVSRDPYSPDRLGLLGELRRALDERELVLHYQPKVSLASGEVTGVEALVRWEHPRRGLLPPAEFVPLAERTGLIADLTRRVLDLALGQCRAWRDRGLDIPVAINLAAANVVDAALPDAIAEALERHGLPGDRLECEISEHTVMADPRRAAEVLGRLRAMGVRLSLDDFGTGHSSLAYLKRLPLDDVKIDRSFVAGMAEDENDHVIVRSTIDLARNLGLGVVAEGVETAQVLEGLTDLRCDTAQGFFLSRPLPAADLDAWLASRSAADRA